MSYPEAPLKEVYEKFKPAMQLRDTLGHLKFIKNNLPSTRAEYEKVVSAGIYYPYSLIKPEMVDIIHRIYRSAEDDKTKLDHSIDVTQEFKPILQRDFTPVSGPRPNLTEQHLDTYVEGILRFLKRQPQYATAINEETLPALSKAGCLYFLADKACDRVVETRGISYLLSMVDEPIDDTKIISNILLRAFPDEKARFNEYQWNETTKSLSFPHLQGLSFIPKPGCRIEFVYTKPGQPTPSLEGPLNLNHFACVLHETGDQTVFKRFRTEWERLQNPVEQPEDENPIPSIKNKFSQILYAANYTPLTATLFDQVNDVLDSLARALDPLVCLWLPTDDIQTVCPQERINYHWTKGLKDTENENVGLLELVKWFDTYVNLWQLHPDMPKVHLDNRNITEKDDEIGNGISRQLYLQIQGDRKAHVIPAHYAGLLSTESARFVHDTLDQMIMPERKRADLANHAALHLTWKPTPEEYLREGAAHALAEYLLLPYLTYLQDKKIERRCMKPKQKPVEDQLNLV